MKKLFNISLCLLFFSTFSQSVFAQSSGGDTNYLIISFIAIGIFLLLGGIITLADNLLQIEAKKRGVDTDKNKMGLFPNLRDVFGKSNKDYTEGSYVYQLKKGFDIKLEGEANKEINTSANVTRYAIKPTNFRGLPPIPRVIVQEGDEVLAGDVLFHDKIDDRVKFVSPVSGEIVSITRGAKRAISQIEILADREQNYKRLNPPSIEEDRQEIVDFLLESGGWSLINQRPFDMIADYNFVPENIFISTFNSAPLAPSLDLVVDQHGEAFQKGLDVLSKLTNGDVHLGLNAGGVGAPSEVFLNSEGVKKHWFSGPHPSGNVGIQIHHVAPISPKGVVWTLKVQDVVTIGNLFLKGIFDAHRIVAITGAEVAHPGYVETIMGANIGDLLKDKIIGDNNRIVAGDVLSGKQSKMNDYLNAFDDQITVLEEGDDYELFGWLLAFKPRPSISKTYPGFLMPNFKHTANTNTHGEKRAFVMTGQYESMLPMDIYPQHLMKAIMTGDIERMEGLGIRELSEEDLALCEFSCTSKMPLQSILRDGLEMLREQS